MGLQFTQLDMEMSFMDEAGIITLAENLVATIFDQVSHPTSLENLLMNQLVRMGYRGSKSYPHSMWPSHCHCRVMQVLRKVFYTQETGLP